jgi:preprotein translocase subunit SecG
MQSPAVLRNRSFSLGRGSGGGFVIGGGGGFKSRLIYYLFTLFFLVIILLFYLHEQSSSSVALPHRNIQNPHNHNPSFETLYQNKKKTSFSLRGAAARERAATGRGLQDYDHLIIVPGHAVMKISEIHRAKESEDAWYLLDYQLGQGFPQIIHSHIQEAINIAKSDDHSILIFSGGQTREDVGPMSEAASYYYYAQYHQLLSAASSSSSSAPALMVGLEEYARDSYENILFSICRFHEITGIYPQKITVVGFDFKSRRFTEIIRKAVKFPENSFRYIGIQPDLHLFHYDTALHGEEFVYHSLQEDMYGCHTEELRHKREERDPYLRTIPYTLSCEELKALLTWCESTLYPGHVPWMG